MVKLSTYALTEREAEPVMARSTGIEYKEERTGDRGEPWGIPRFEIGKVLVI
jgi:hypothetical protein